MFTRAPATSAATLFYPYANSVNGAIVPATAKASVASTGANSPADGAVMPPENVVPLMPTIRSAASQSRQRGRAAPGSGTAEQAGGHDERADDPDPAINDRQDIDD